MAKTGRPRKIESPEVMAELWEEYKEYCNNQTVTRTEFSAKEGRFIEGEVKCSITATIEGFCVYIGLIRSDFYRTYAESEEFSDIVSRIREESEQDVRTKFEREIIPTKLAGLWMARYEGYNQKQQIDVNATVSEADKKLLENVSKRLEQGKKPVES